jgi:hypothetical protein
MVLARRDDPRVLPGSLITLRRKCGKVGCRCVTGAPHETPALSYSVAGRTRMLTLTAAEVPAVAAAVARYRKAVTDLESEARTELGVLVARVEARRAGSGDRGGCWDRTGLVCGVPRLFRGDPGLAGRNGVGRVVARRAGGRARLSGPTAVVPVVSGASGLARRARDTRRGHRCPRHRLWHGRGRASPRADHDLRDRRC